MITLSRHTLAKLLLNIVLLLGALYLYAQAVEVYGGFSAKFLHLQWLEVVAVVYIYAFIFVILKPSRWQALLAAAPIFMVYVVHDVFFFVYSKVFRFINLTEVPELLQILPWYGVALLAVLFIVPLVIIIARIDYRRPWPIVAGVSPLLLLAVVIESSPQVFANSFESMANEIVKYSDGKSVEANGRLAMLLYREAQRSATVQKIEPYRNRGQYEELAAQRVAELQDRVQPRNVHLIVMESFLDPRLFKNLKFSHSPVHPEFEKLFGGKLGFSISPVFGGSTAQAEFEVLCGVPAFERLSSVEFNAFTGAPAHCLPGMLSALGYRSVASNAYKPNFFNAQPAYRGMGFPEQQYPVEFYNAQPTYLRFGDPGIEDYIFDGDLFAQNLDFVKRHMEQNSGKPMFNYVLTMYGHTPHILDPVKRPEFIQMESDFGDDHMQHIVNQFYYRTEAIANYVKQLSAIDKDSLIIFVSDHVPPLRYGPNSYDALRYMDNREQALFYNRIAIVENGRAVKYQPMRHYELPDLVLDYVSGGEHCKRHECAHRGHQTAPREARLDAYLTLMAHASE